MAVKDFRYGILVVHGIGFQKQGETARRWSEALAAWLSCWVTRQARRQVAVTLGELRGSAGSAVEGSVVQDPADADAPARTLLSVQTRSGGVASWLVAESWWADAFEQPKVLELVSWIVLSTPFLIVSHLSTPLLRTWRRLGSRARWWRKALLGIRAFFELAAVFLVAVPLSLLVVGVFVVLLLPTLIPIAQVRAATKAFATRVFGLLGDTFVVTMSPVRRDLVVNKVAQDIAWLAGKCDAIAVVAHSQGAALAHDALRRSEPPELESLVTLGSGIQKLLRLRLAFHNGRALVAYAWIPPAFVVAGAAGLAATLTRAGALREWAAVLTSAALLVGLALLGLAAYRFFKAKGYEARLELPGAGARFRWLDIYASADPVPNGPTYSGDVNWLEEQEVFIHASLFRDHTAYLQDDEGVLPLLAEQFTARFDSLRFDDQARSRVSDARWRRRLRMRVLSVARALLAAAAIVAGLNIDTTALGATVASSLPHILRQPLDTLVKPLPLSLRGHDAGGICAWLILSLGAYALFVLTFRFWASRERKMFFCGHSVGNPLPAGGERVFFGGLSLVLLAAELALGSAIAARRSWRVPAWIALHHPVALLVSLVLVVCLLTAGARSKKIIRSASTLEQSARSLFDRQREP